MVIGEITFWKTQYLGPNIKILGTLLVPIPFVFLLFLLSIGSFIYGFWFSLREAMEKTINSKSHIIYGGFSDTYTNSMKNLHFFWVNYHLELKKYFYKMRTDKCAKPFDIPLIVPVFQFLVALTKGICCALTIFISFLVFSIGISVAFMPYFLVKTVYMLI
jgi:hypothetical protein